MNFILALTLFLFYSSASYSADSEAWTSVAVEQKLNEKFGLYGEFIYRYSEEAETHKVLSNRLGLTFKFENKWKAAVLIEVRNTDNINNNESRNIFQFSRGFEFESFKFSTRVRWELRNFADSEVSMNRFRLFNRIDFSKLNLNEWVPYVTFEPFFITNTVSSRLAGSREYRSQIGLSRDFSSCTLDVAYLYRQQTSPATATSSAKDSRYNILNLSLKYNF